LCEKIKKVGYNIKILQYIFIAHLAVHIVKRYNKFSRVKFSQRKKIKKKVYVTRLFQNLCVPREIAAMVQ